jgi:glutathione S-transferase
VARFVNLWSDNTLNPLIRRLISADFIACLAPEDRAYFRSSREAAFSMTLEAAYAERPEVLPQFEAACLPLERLLGEQDFLSGREPRYADYVVFSVFQWARLGSPHDLVRQGSAVERWRARMIALFGGLADKFPGYPAPA